MIQSAWMVSGLFAVTVYAGQAAAISSKQEISLLNHEKDSKSKVALSISTMSQKSQVEPTFSCRAGTPLYVAPYNHLYLAMFLVTQRFQLKS